MVEDAEQKKGSVDASDYDKVATDNRYLTFLLKCFVDHHTDVNKLNRDLLCSLVANAQAMVTPANSNPLCPHQKTKWNITFTAGTCQDCGKRLGAGDYLPKLN